MLSFVIISFTLLRLYRFVQEELAPGIGAILSSNPDVSIELIRESTGETKKATQWVFLPLL
jgi:hypothetical protein